MSYSDRDSIAFTLDRVSAVLRDREQVIEQYARILPAQRVIRFGSAWVRFLHDERGCAWSAPVHHVHWGRVLTVREYAAGRLTAGDTAEELLRHVADLRARHGRGWRLSLVYCDATGQPELRSVPLAGIWPCTMQEYRRARSVDFITEGISNRVWFRQLQKRYRQETARQAQEAGIIGEDLRLASLKEEDHHG